MKACEKEISKEIYDRAVLTNHGIIPESDMTEIFPQSELSGYGVYFPRAFERDGKYFVGYKLGDSCD